MSWAYLTNLANECFKSGVAVTASSEAAGYPVSNLLAGKPFRTTGVASERMDFDLGAAKAISAAILRGHNLSSAAVVKVQGMPLANFEGFHDQSMSRNPSIYLRFGEVAASPTAADESGNGNDGTYNNAPTLEAPGAIAASGDPDTAVTLNGVDQDITVPHDGSLDLGGAGSISVWVKPNRNTGADMMIANKGYMSPDGWFLMISPFIGNKIVFGNYSAGFIAFSTASPAVGEWNHILITRTGTTTRIYLNKNNVTAQISTSAIPDNTDDLDIGSFQSTSKWFDGSIDEFEMFPTALTAADAVALHNSGSAASRFTIPYREWDAFALFTSQSYRYWRFTIEDPTNPYGFLKFETPMLGTYIQPTFELAWGSRIIPRFTSRRMESAYMVPSVEAVGRRREQQLVMGGLTDAEVSDLFALYESLGKDVTPFFFIPDVNVNQGYFGRFGDMEYTQDPGGVIEVPFLEDGRGNLVAL